jgi:urea transport system permease protein
MTFALLLAFFRNDMGFGGNNGLTDFKDILGFPVQAQGTRATLFALSALALAGGFLLCRFIVVSKLGKVLVAIRDAESRTRFIGYRVENYKLFVWTVSAMLAGVAGALYVPQVGIINPSEFAPANSIEAVIWVAVGGRGTLAGPHSGPSRSMPERPGSRACCRNCGCSRSGASSSSSRSPAEGHSRHRDGAVDRPA